MNWWLSERVGGKMGEIKGIESKKKEKERKERKKSIIMSTNKFQKARVTAGGHYYSDPNKNG